MPLAHLMLEKYIFMLVKNISHITIVAKDMKRTAQFFVDTLGAVEVYRSGARQHSIFPEIFITLGGVWLAIMQAEDGGQTKSYGHIAFSVDDINLGDLELRLKKAGVEIVKSRPRIAGEGNSIYFYDFDCHLFELHSGTLEERLKRYSQLEISV